jgi:uroporphyrinogen III methyltransferase/synthase
MKALAGKRIVVTRSREQADELVFPLQELGAEVLLIPTIEIVPPDSWEFCDAAIERLVEYDWMIFSSTNGVRFFVDRLREKGHQIEKIAPAKIAAVGERTRSALEEIGIRVNLMPEEFRAEGLVQAFAKIDLREKRILIPKAQESREVLFNELIAMGAQMDAVPVYKNQLPAQNRISEMTKSLNGHSVDVLTFTSPSTARNFVEMIGRDKVARWIKSGCKIAAIGGVTAEALNELGLPADILPKKFTIPDLAEAIENFFNRNR